MKLGLVRKEDVIDMKTWAQYTQQKTGIPLRAKDYPAVNKHIKVLFEQYRNADWQTLVKVTDWCVQHRRRFESAVGVVCEWPRAFRDGHLPELLPSSSIDADLKRQCYEAAELETDAKWKRALMLADTDESRRELLEEWQTERGSLFSQVRSPGRGSATTAKTLI